MPERLTDPQQFNLYGYTRNNPLRYVDPTGKVFTISGNFDEALKQLREMLEPNDPEKRITYDAKTQTFTVDLRGIDLESNESAKLLNDLKESKNHYNLSLGPTVETKGGTIQVGSNSTNLNLGDIRFQNMEKMKLKSALAGKYKPPDGIDSQVGVDTSGTQFVYTSKTDLKVAPDFTRVFHELAEAYAKVDGGMQYEAAHEEAKRRELILRDQRPYLKQFNMGTGEGGGVTIKR